MKLSGTVRERLQRLFTARKHLTAGELVFESYQLISDEAQATPPADRLMEMLDESGRTALKEAAAAELAILGNAEGFRIGYVAVEVSANETLAAGKFVPRSFVEALASWASR
jgi:hypothetical protein